MATIEQILQFRNLTGVIRAIKSGIPNPLEGLGFMNPTRQVPGNKAEFFRIFGTRRVARQVQYGAPAVRRVTREIDDVPITMVHSLESQQWPMALLIALTKMTDLSRDQKGEQQAIYQSREFKALFSNLRIAATLYSLLQGVLHFDKDGNLSSSAATTTGGYDVNFNIPATNYSSTYNTTANINGAGTLSTLSAWNTTSTSIITQLLQLQTVAEKKTGYSLDTCFHSDEIPEYIGANTTAQAYLARNPGMNQQFINNPTVIPDGFGGIRKWIRAGHTFFEDSGGTQRAIMPASSVVFVPAYSPEWFEMFEGSYLVPNSVLPVIGGDASTISQNCTEMFGMFGYGLLSMNPVMVEQFAGDTFLPVPKVPEAIFQAYVGA